VPSLVGLKTAGGDDDWYTSMRKHLSGLSVFVHLSFNHKPNALRELRRDLITKVMPSTRGPLGLRLSELHKLARLNPAL
jgi:hypothetical protein